MSLFQTFKPFNRCAPFKSLRTRTYAKALLDIMVEKK